MSKQLKKLHREVVKIADKLGVDVLDTTKTKHYLFTIKRRSDGKVAKTWVSGSPKNLHPNQIKRQITRVLNGEIFKGN